MLKWLIHHTYKKVLLVKSNQNVISETTLNKYNKASNKRIMEFLFKSRGAGKRQVKPSQDIDMLADQIAGNQGDGSSDDSDFKIDDKSSDDEDESDSDAEVCIILQLLLNTFCQSLY